MADKFSGFADNLINGALNPKGNLADWQHASRLFVTDALSTLVNLQPTPTPTTDPAASKNMGTIFPKKKKKKAPAAT